MFSGIVEKIVRVIAVEHTAYKSTLFIEGTDCMEGSYVGDSISVNGVCLTITELRQEGFVFEAMPETLRCSNLGLLSAGNYVNIERSMQLLTRVGGHLVQGHIDGTSVISSIEPDGCALKIWFKKLDAYKDCFIPKGYVAIDGMSLTIVDVVQNAFSVCFIPHTQAVTIVQHYKEGTHVNVEIDPVVKTVAFMLEQREKVYGQHK